MQTNLSVQTMKTSILIILQSRPTLGLGNHIFANLPSHLSALLPLDVDLMALIEVSNNLHGEVGLHLICSPVYLRIKYLFFEKSCGPSWCWLLSMTGLLKNHAYWSIKVSCNLVWLLPRVLLVPLFSFLHGHADSLALTSHRRLINLTLFRSSARGAIQSERSKTDLN